MLVLFWACSTALETDLLARALENGPECGEATNMPNEDAIVVLISYAKALRVPFKAL